MAHKAFRARPVDEIVAKLAPGGVYVDVKSAADAGALASRGVKVWRL